MVIDFHTHCFTDTLAPLAIPKLEKSSGITAAHDGTAKGLMQHMKQCGIDKGVVLPVATKPTQVRTINEWSKQTANDSLIFFGALHPEDPDLEQTVNQLKNDGFLGVKLHPDYQQFFADDISLMPLYDMLRSAGLILVIHTGVDVAYPEMVHCTPLMLKNVVKNMPGLKIVAAHMGSHALWRDVEEVLIGLPIYLDTSYSHYALGDETMLRMIRAHGAENVLFGTDSPWKSADDEIARISGLGLTAEEQELIFYKNALSLLKMS